MAEDKKDKKGKTTTYSQTIKGNRATAASHRRQAKLLEQLIKNRRSGIKELRGQYKNAIRRNAATRKSVVADLVSGQKTALEGYDRAETDAQSNLGEIGSSSMLNRAREGASAMAELSNLQAGETDRIRGMAASLRNMKANLDNGASDYASAMTSINNSIGDLNSSVSTNINNALREQNTSNAQAHAEWLTGRQQGYSDLVDLYGQLGSTYEQVADARATKKSKTRSTGKDNITTVQTNSTKYGKQGRRALRKVKNAFNQSAAASETLSELQGATFTNPIMTISQMNKRLDKDERYIPAQTRENKSNLDDLDSAGTLRKMEAPQGSQLRKTAV